MAFGVIAGLRAAGRRVPDDVSVAGFDNVPESPFMSPPLTTVRQDFTALGELATRALVAAINGAPDTARTVLSPTLEVRESTAKARAGEG
jgi:DNA-binding LacI/PurR family transcriptional regulator